MKWIAIAGTWWKTNSEIEKTVRETVRSIITRGDGVISGGALDVDYFALDEALKHNPTAEQIKIFIPSSLETYRDHYATKRNEKAVSPEQSQMLITQLEGLKRINENALIEGPEKLLNKEAYFNAITTIINASDELIAFHVNHSEGTQDAIDKAYEKGIPVNVFSYTIE
jgi:hypothetical protein